MATKPPLAASSPFDLISPSVPPTTNWIDDYFLLHVQLPPVLRMGYNIRQGRQHGIEPSPEQVARLRPRAEALRAAVLAWHDKYMSQGVLAEPVQVPSTDPTSPYEMVLKYRNPWEGSMLMNYWTTVLILQESLNQCHSGPDLLFTDNQKLANNILRSLEHVGQGLMGPHRVGYSLRVAYDFVSEPTQTWTLIKISRYNDTYAATSADVYPANPLFDRLSSSHEKVESRPLSWID